MSESEVEPESTARYDAFVSYSHALDGRLAPALQRCLHRLAKPWYLPRALRVFRDNENLAANDNLWQTISAALATSRYFILLASPRAAASKWVRREVAYWQDNRDRGTFLIVLTDGTITWEDARSDFDWDHTTALPPQLSGWFGSEPLWVDLTWARQETELSVRHSRFRSEVATLAASLHGRAKDELDSEDVRQHRLATRLRRAVVIALSLLTVVATVLGVVALNRQQELSDQRNRSMSRELAAKSETLADSDPVVAKLLSVAAWRISPTSDAHAGMLRAAAHPGIAKLAQSGPVINSVAFSPDGKVVAVGSDNNAVRLLDIDSRRQVGEALTGHTEAVQTVVFSPDGETLATSGDDGRVRLWDRDTHRQTGAPIPDLDERSLDLRMGFNPPVAFSPDGAVLAIGSSDGSVRLYDLDTQQQIGDPLTGHIPNQLPVVGPAVAFSPNGTTLASAATDGTIRFWDVRTHQQIGLPVVGHPPDAVAFDNPSVVFNPDGKTMVTSATDGTVRLWNTNTRLQIGPPLTGPTPDRVTIPPAVAFSPSRNTLAIGEDNGTIQLWDVAKRRQIGDPMTGHTGPVSSVTFSSDGKKLVSGARDGTVRLWDVSARQQFDFPLAAHTGPVYSAAFSPDGRLLATGGDDGGAAHNHDSMGACAPPAGKGCTSGGPGRGRLATVLLWDVRTRTQVGDPLTSNEDSISAVVFSPDGSKLVTGSQHGSVRLWELKKRQELSSTPNDGEFPISSLAISLDGKVLAGGSARKRWIVLRDADSLQHLDTLTMGDDGSTYSVAFSPDGKSLAVGLDDGKVLLWDVQTRHQIGAPLGGHSGPVNAIAFNSTGTMLATAGEDGTVRLWDVETHQQTGDTLIGHTGPANSVTFSPDGLVLATGGGDNSVRLWDVAARKQISGPYLGHDLPVWAVRFSPDGRTLASGGEDNMVRLWDVAYTMDVATWLCANAKRSLTAKEWARYVPDVPYQKVCPS